MANTDKKCANPSCSMRGTVISTELKICITCSKELVPNFDLNNLGDLLGGLFKK